MTFPGVKFLDFMRQGFCWVPDIKTGRPAPMRLYPLQETFGREVWDTLDPVTGVRRFRRAVFSVPKKFGKTSLGSACGLYHLLFDPFEHNREIYSIAGKYDQALLSIHKARRMIAQSPRLSALFKDQPFYQDKIVYQDKETGEEHKWVALAKDSPSTQHGNFASMCLVDEGWQFAPDDYDILEAVAFGPQRRSPLQLWVSYAGSKFQMIDGAPLFDLYRAGMAGTDRKLYFCWRSGVEAYDELPPEFIREGRDAYLEEQRAMLPINEFKRLCLNEWADGDSPFLTDEERNAAASVELVPIETSVEPHVLAIDYGRVSDHSAIVLARKGLPPTQVVVSNAIVFKGSRDNPVPVALIEQTVLDLMTRFRIERIVVDQWQMYGTAESLSKRLGWPLFNAEAAESQPFRRAIVLRSIGPQYLNRLTMVMLALFRSKGIKIPAALIELLDQLSSVITKDTFYGVRIDSGPGAGVRGHDDIVIALGMAALELMGRGRGVELPPFTCVAGAQYARQCFLLNPAGRIVPYDGVPACRECKGWTALKAAHHQATALNATALDLLTFHREHVAHRPALVGSMWSANL